MGDFPWDKALVRKSIKTCQRITVGEVREFCRECMRTGSIEDDAFVLYEDKSSICCKDVVSPSKHTLLSEMK